MRPNRLENKLKRTCRGSIAWPRVKRPSLQTVILARAPLLKGKSNLMSVEGTSSTWPRLSKQIQPDPSQGMKAKQLCLKTKWLLSKTSWFQSLISAWIKDKSLKHTSKRRSRRMTDHHHASLLANFTVKTTPAWTFTNCRFPSSLSRPSNGSLTLSSATPASEEIVQWTVLWQFSHARLLNTSASSPPQTHSGPWIGGPHRSRHSRSTWSKRSSTRSTWSSAWIS